MESHLRKRHIGVFDTDGSASLKVVRIDKVECKHKNDDGIENNIREKRNKSFTRKDSGYSSLDLEDEDDVIHACDVDVRCESTPPDSLDGHDNWLSTGRQSGKTFIGNIFNVGLLVSFLYYVTLRPFSVPFQLRMSGQHLVNLFTRRCLGVLYWLQGIGTLLNVSFKSEMWGFRGVHCQPNRAQIHKINNS